MRQNSNQINVTRRKYTVRYGLTRYLTDNGHGIFTVEGEAHHTRRSDDMFDAEGGVLGENALFVGEDYGFGKILSIMVEDAPKGSFKIRLEVEQD